MFKVSIARLVENEISKNFGTNTLAEMCKNTLAEILSHTQGFVKFFDSYTSTQPFYKKNKNQKTFIHVFRKISYIG